MRRFEKRTLSMLLALCIVILLFAGLSITAFADAAETLNLTVMGKDGEAAWTETWYFQDGTSTEGYMDATITEKPDGTGNELSIVKDFTDYAGFGNYGSLVYSGWRRTWPILACCKRGILLEDLIDYVETQSGYDDLRGDTGIQMFDPTGWKLPNSTDPVKDGKYSEFFWGNATRYYYPDFYANTGIGGNDSQFIEDNRIEVPAVLSMVGYYYNTSGTTLETIQSQADTMMSLRLFFGTDPANLHDGSAGNGSGKNMKDIYFYPVYNAINVTGGTASGTEGEDGYNVTANNTSIITGDDWFKAAEGEEVTLTVTPASNYAVNSVTVTDADSGNVTVTRASNEFSFIMPDSAVTVAVTTSDITNPETPVYAVALPESLDDIWTVATDAEDGKAATGQIVTVTVTRDDDALTASIGGITVVDDSRKSVEVIEGAATKDAYNNVKVAAYSFAMPASSTAVTLNASYATLTVSQQRYPGAEVTTEKTFTRAQLVALDEEDNFYYGGFDSTPSVIEGKGTVSISLTDMLAAADVEFLPGDTITVESIDGTEKTMSYAELYSSGRYYFPALYTGYDWPSRSNGKILSQPHFIITGAQANSSGFGNGENIDSVAGDSAYACQLAFGLTMDEFSINPDATPSAAALTARGYVKHITAVTVNHAYNYDVTWYVGHEGEASYTIDTSSELMGLAAIVNGTAVDSSYNAVAQSSFADKTVTLGADIALTSEWTPIGLATIGSNSTTSNPYVMAGSGFAGTFDGNGKTISEISITTAGSGIGLFGYVAPTGVVKNMTLTGAVNVSGSYDAIGAVAGYNSGTITGVINRAAVTNAGGYNVGGITGFNDGYYTQDALGLIENCGNEANVSSNNSKVGGIVGENSGMVNGCYNSGTVHSTGAKAGAGGIVGRNGNNNTAAETGTVINCYNIATVTGSSKWSGGIAGFNNAKSSITNCYTSAGTAYTGGYANPIAGNQEGAAKCSNNYSLTGLSATGNTEEEIGIIKTADEMRAAAFAGLLGDGFKANSGCYPVLSWQTASGHNWNGGVISIEAGGRIIKTYTCLTCGAIKIEVVSEPSSGGSKVDTTGLNLTSATWDGITVDVSWYIEHESSNSYTINTAAKLAGVAAICNGLVNDNCKVYTGKAVINAAEWNDSSFVNNDTGNHGACNRATDDYSYGVDDFNGKTIKLTKNLDMSTGNYMPIGGQYLMEIDDHNTKIGSSFCGMFDGGGHSVTLECNRWCSDGTYGDGQSVGLIGRLGVHDNDPTSMRPAGAGVHDVAVYGSIKANRSVGGIVGKIGKTAANNSGNNDDGPVIARCANYADISGTDAKGTGGIVGAAWNGGTITDCYNAGDIKNTHNAYAGIAGSNEVPLINCYNRGKITGVGTSAAIASQNATTATYTNCCWLNTSANVGVYSSLKSIFAGVVSKTSTEMQSEAFLNQMGSAFAADTNNINGGYPVLSWQNPSAPTGTGVVGTAATPTVEIEATTTVTGGAATTSVTDKAVTASIAAAATKKADTIIIKTDTDGKTASGTTVELPKTSAMAIADAKLKLSIETADGSHVTLAPETMSSITEQASGSNIEISVTPKTKAEATEIINKTDIKDADLKNSLSVSVTVKSGGKEICSFSGSMTIDLPADSNYTEGENYKVVQISADGSVNILTGKCVKADGKLYVRVTVTHLSNFIVTNEKTMPFTDISGHWALDTIGYVYNNGLFAGTSDTTFSPDVAMTRAMLVTALYRLDGSPAAITANTFTDVKSGIWYTDAVEWAAKNKIVDGYGGGLFGANDSVTREQMAAVLYRYANFKQYDTTQGGMAIREYEDYAKISDWALSAMGWANAAGLIKGRTTTTLVPTGMATRAEVATILMRFSQNIVK